MELDIGLLIANAGIYIPGKFFEIDGSILESMLDANVYHVAAIIKKFLPQLVQRKGKRFGIITVSSAVGYTPCPYNTTYAATKSFVN